jgi:hypothetical protein
MRPKSERRTYERSAQFSDKDAENLRRHFSKPLRSGIGANSGSNLGSGDGTNPNSTEQPKRTEPRCPICASKVRSGTSRWTKESLKTWFRDHSLRELGQRLAAEKGISFRKARPLVLAMAVASSGLTEERTRELSAPMTPGHDHSRNDREAVEPIRVYDKEINGQLVQVKVMPPSLEPLAQASWAIDAKDTGGSGKFGSWDDQACDYVQARVGQAEVNGILDRLSHGHQDALESYYSTLQDRGSGDAALGALAGVALLTKAAQRAHAELAAEGVIGSMRATISSLMDRIGGKGPIRDAAIRHRDAIRREAEALLIDAKSAYAQAAAAA